MHSFDRHSLKKEYPSVEYPVNVINLKSKQIQDLNPHTFRYLIHLTHLDLSNNWIETLHRDTFQGLVNLVVIDLSHNKLKKLDPYIFNGLENLKKIYLNNNDFKKNEKLKLVLESSVSFVSFKSVENLLDPPSNDIDSDLVKVMFKIL